jgi:hypothetical protein
MATRKIKLSELTRIIKENMFEKPGTSPFDDFKDSYKKGFNPSDTRTPKKDSRFNIGSSSTGNEPSGYGSLHGDEKKKYDSDFIKRYGDARLTYNGYRIKRTSSWGDDSKYVYGKIKMGGNSWDKERTQFDSDEYDTVEDAMAAIDNEIESRRGGMYEGKKIVKITESQLKKVINNVIKDKNK